ncbi:MAG: hypothetical protein AAGC71_11600 [Pseudomonadota bacterium]
MIKNALVFLLMLAIALPATAGVRDDVAGRVLQSERAVVAAARQRSARDAVERAAQARYEAQRRTVARAQAQTAQSVRRAESVSGRSPTSSPTSQFQAVRDPAVIYLREDPVSRRLYVGRSKNTTSYLQRQIAHDRSRQRALATHQQAADSVNQARHRFQVIGTANGRQAARVGEESAIRSLKNSPTTGSRMANRRYEMNEQSYRQSGGHVQRAAPSVTQQTAGLQNAPSASAAFNRGAR